MRLFDSVFRLRISSKLLWFNCTITIVFVFVFLAALLSYRHVQSLLTTTVEQSLDLLVTNARISRGLSTVFADTNYLFNTFYEKQNYLDHTGRRLIASLEDLQQKTPEKELVTLLTTLLDTLRVTLEQSSRVNSHLFLRQEIQEGIDAVMDQLEQNITDKIIDWVVRGEDPTTLEQMAALVGGYRESLMEIDKIRAELWPDHFTLPLDEKNDPVLKNIANLVLRLKTMTAADEEIARMVETIILRLDIYKDNLLDLHSSMERLQHNRDTFEKHKYAVLALMEQIDLGVVEISQDVRGRITETFKVIGGVGLVIGLLLIGFWGVMTTLFFKTILKNPMQQIQEGIRRFSTGALDSPIRLGRTDEWAGIEEALNTMAGDLAATYTQLETKIAELEESIVARREAEKAVRDSEEKYRSIFENALDGIYQVSWGGRILSANSAFARIFGFTSPEEMIATVKDLGKQFYVNPDERQRLLQLLEENGSVADFEARYIRRDGTVIWGSINARLMVGDHDERGHIEGIFKDISDRKRAAEEKQVLEEQLRQSQKMEAMGSLAGGIAHDFNNLLHAISGYLELLLLRKNEGDPDMSYLQEINRATTRATEIAQRLLTFSRKIEARTVQVDCNQVVADTLKILEHSLPKMITIETHLAEDLGLVSADPTQLEQVVMNLAGNAADAMPEGGKLVLETVNIYIDSEYQARHLEMEEGQYTVIRVTDTGHGIEKAEMDRIFEPFYTTKEVGKGTGLGLAIVYSIVKSAMGHITCYSEPGVGTTFTVYLPQTAAQEGRGEKAAPPGNVVTSFKGEETILVVDDEDMIRDIAEEMLVDFGYTVLTASSGEQALHIIDELGEGIHLMILDLGMPGMGGERCLEEIQKKDLGLKVIVASGYAAHKIARYPKKYGVSGFVGKPYKLQEMMTLVRRVLDLTDGVP